jgi:ABC-type spermidine/putrescine transport system, permease component II
MTKTQKKNITGVFKNIYIYLVFLFLYLPIFYVIIFSFNTSKLNITFESFTFQWYGSFFKNRTLMEALTNTLIVGVLSTIVSTIIGTIGAIGLSKYKFRGKELIDKLLYIPIVIPEVVLGIALLSIYSMISMP